MKKEAFIEFAKPMGKHDSQEMQLYFEGGWDKATEFWKKEFEYLVIENQRLRDQTVHYMGQMYLHGARESRKGKAND